VRSLPPTPFLYAIVDVASLGGRSVRASIAELALGGARLVQFRAKGLTDRLLFEQSVEAVAGAREAGVPLVLNDRPDIALIIGADGVHVGQEDLPPEECRRLLGADAIVGVSTHNREELRAAVDAPVDYVAVGPVFPTVTKQATAPVVGLDFLRLARGITSKPLVAIGGITRANVAEVASAGADGVAVISDLLRHQDLTEAARAFCGALRPSHG
jgi:thiamine-phosphate pyrophosphorylase